MVATPTGWTTLAELQVGDEVLDETGAPCRVLAKSEIFEDHECFELVFDDGERIIADAEHRWWTFTEKDRNALLRRSEEFRQRRRQNRGSRAGGKKSALFREALSERNRARAEKHEPAPVLGGIHTTREIAATLRTKDGRRVNHSVPLAAPLRLPEADLPLPPYTLGAWLGDGDTRGGRISVAPPDEGTLRRIEEEGFAVYHIPSCLYGWRIKGLTTRLRTLGVYGDKHIPPVYLRASFEQRLELLRGLMDTDGCCDADGGAEFTSTREQLARGTLELARTLGIKATLTEGRATLNGRDCGPKFRVKMTTDLRIFHLERKAGRQKSELRPTQRQRYIVECKPVPPVPVQCIAVSSPSRLFLISAAFVPTHNSDSLLMAALQYVHVPGYAALLFRRTYKDLSLPGALMDRANTWLRGTDAKWNDPKKTWTFPSGASLTFGHLDTENDKYQYQGAEFHFIGFDELTQFSETAYRYLLSRLRRQAGSEIPTRMRAASNPGGLGHEWVRSRFVDPGDPERPFIPARLEDNPYLDLADYEASLAQLDPVTRAQLRAGDWDVLPEGRLFRREWFKIIEPRDLPPLAKTVRFWDLAATEAKAGTDPDWTAGAKVGRTAEGAFYVLDVRRLRDRPQAVEALIQQTAEEDGKGVAIWMEQEPGSSGVALIDYYTRKALAGYTFRGLRSTGSKEVRAGPVSSQAEAGNVRLLRGAWNSAFLDEISPFPTEGLHDDQVDALSGAMERLAASRQMQVYIL